MNFRILPEADDEVIAGMFWYDAQLPGLGDRFYASVAFAFDAIRDHPTRCARVPRYRGMLELRQTILDGFPYVIIFLIGEDDILIVSVAHSKRRPFFWLSRLKNI